MKMDSEKPFTKVNDCTACLMHRFLHKSCSGNAINFTNWPRKAPEMNPGLRGRGCAPAGFVEMLCFTSKRGIPFTVCGKNEWFWSVPSWCELSERGAQNCVCGSVSGGGEWPRCSCWSHRVKSFRSYPWAMSTSWFWSVTPLGGGFLFRQNSRTLKCSSVFHVSVCISKSSVEGRHLFALFSCTHSFFLRSAHLSVECQL